MRAWRAPLWEGCNTGNENEQLRNGSLKNCAYFRAYPQTRAIARNCDADARRPGGKIITVDPKETAAFMLAVSVALAFLTGPDKKHIELRQHGEAGTITVSGESMEWTPTANRPVLTTLEAQSWRFTKNRRPGAVQESIPPTEDDGTRIRGVPGPCAVESATLETAINDFYAITKAEKSAGTKQGLK